MALPPGFYGGEKARMPGCGEAPKNGGFAPPCVKNRRFLTAFPEGKAFGDPERAGDGGIGAAERYLNTVTLWLPFSSSWNTGLRRVAPI